MSEESESAHVSHVLPKNMGGGPMGLGDPNDRSLRKVERDIIIPKMIKEEIQKLFCASEYKAFNECGKKHGLMLPFKCRKENSAISECSIKWFNDEKFVNEMTEKFLNERSDYRKTGVPARIFNRPRGKQKEEKTEIQS